ncbi:MAG: zinc ribbon domain-containing protein [Clostridiales bacterium]|nr:zinc ribbon domain-containing protein [Clostridiales bacterium]
MGPMRRTEGTHMQNDRCPACGAMTQPDDKYCPQCGIPLRAEAKTAFGESGEPGAKTAFGESGEPGTTGFDENGVPETIEALKQWCEGKGMPLRKMRFFIDEDYRGARAFGIYREPHDAYGRNADVFVVYKNKSDASRAERYRGPDEAYAVRELYEKLLDECHKRDKWPDGRPQEAVRRSRGEKSIKALIAGLVTAVAVIAVLAGFVYMIYEDYVSHSHDGYYAWDDAALYYLYGGDWYFDDGYGHWTRTYDTPYDDYADYEGYYLGDDYESDWGYSDFSRSDTWEDLHESDDSDDDYDDWDWSDTDWDSDW